MNRRNIEELKERIEDIQDYKDEVNAEQEQRHEKAKEQFAEWIMNGNGFRFTDFLTSKAWLFGLLVQFTALIALCSVVGFLVGVEAQAVMQIMTNTMLSLGFFLILLAVMDLLMHPIISAICRLERWTHKQMSKNIPN